MGSAKAPPAGPQGGANHGNLGTVAVTLRSQPTPVGWSAARQPHPESRSHVGNPSPAFRSRVGDRDRVRSGGPGRAHGSQRPTVNSSLGRSETQRTHQTRHVPAKQGGVACVPQLQHGPRRSLEPPWRFPRCRLSSSSRLAAAGEEAPPRQPRYPRRQLPPLTQPLEWPPRAEPATSSAMAWTT
jgi:hypothetical protein